MKIFSQCCGIHGGTNKFKQAPNAIIVQQNLTSSSGSESDNNAILGKCVLGKMLLNKGD